MLALVFLLALLMLAFLIGAAGGLRARRRQRWLFVAAAASLPFDLWLVMMVRDSIVFDRPLFDLTDESSRFGFYVGLMLVAWLTPVWAGIGLLGCHIARRTRTGRRDGR